MGGGGTSTVQSTFLHCIFTVQSNGEWQTLPTCRLPLGQVYVMPCFCTKVKLVQFKGCLHSYLETIYQERAFWSRRKTSIYWRVVNFQSILVLHKLWYTVTYIVQVTMLECKMILTSINDQRRLFCQTNEFARNVLHTNIMYLKATGVNIT